MLVGVGESMPVGSLDLQENADKIREEKGISFLEVFDEK